MRCPPHEVQHGALCYSKCPKGYSGNLSTCWQDCNKTPDTKHDGGGICCDSKGTCIKKNADLAIAGIKAGASVLLAILTGGATAPKAAGDVLKLANGLAIHMCDTSGKLPAPSPTPNPPSVVVHRRTTTPNPPAQADDVCTAFGGILHQDKKT